MHQVGQMIKSFATLAYPNNKHAHIEAAGSNEDEAIIQTPDTPPIEQNEDQHHRIMSK
jgi:hypothetical protein